MSFLEKISPFERRDLLFAWFCLAVAFTLGISGGLALITDIGKISVEMLVMTFVVAVVTVGLSFVLHELSHKFVAIRYGYWAEFRKNTQMLLIAVVVAVITGIVFAAPGATLINTAGREMTKKENGIISLAGPLTNLLLAIPFLFCLVAGILLGGASISVFTLPGFLFYLGMVGFQVNAMLAFFNMLPVGPLDGRKILRWNAVAFVALIAVSLLVLYISLQPWMIVALLL
ncbi:MAG: site-2 protease family protein [Methanocalculaceae archaeon]|jgi:Zn-dependent protease|nr:site-2 protease family protein [Methanocalculaceae archaeon]